MPVFRMIRRFHIFLPDRPFVPFPHLFRHFIIPLDNDQAFPFRFVLRMTYTITHNGGVETRFYVGNPGDVPLPATFETMKELAAKLAADFKQVRVDFYEADGKCYFGEMTFFHGAGYMPFTPHSFDREMGDLWTL